MKRVLLVLVAATCLAFGGWVDEPKKGEGKSDQDAAKKEESGLVPDRQWRPKPGDRAEAFGLRTCIADTEVDFDNYEKYKKAGDTKGIEIQIKDEEIFFIEPGSQLLIVQDQHKGRYGYDASVSREARGMDEVLPLEVRVLSGKQKDKRGFVRLAEIARMIPDHRMATRPTAKAPPKKVDPTVRVKSLLRSAQALEKDGKTKGAIDFYQTIVKDYPKTEEAKAATARLKAIKR